MRNSVRRASLVLALTPLVSAPMAAAALAAGGGGTGGTSTTTTVTTQAPSGSSSASALDIPGVLSVSKTSASSGPNGGSSQATALAIGGNTVVGGDNGDDAAIKTGPQPFGDAEVLKWTATHSSDGNGGYQSMADTALAHLDLGGALELYLLHSHSTSYWTPGESGGDSTSDGAEVSALGMLDIKVLHSHAHSGQTGQSDLLVVNGTEIGSSGQANGQCEIPADPLIHLICLTASGGTSSSGATTSGGTVVQVSVGGGQLTGVISGSTSQGGSAPTPQQPKVTHHPAGGGQANGGHTSNGAGGPQAGGLPFTGADVERMGAMAAALAAIGGVMTALARRRRAGFAH